MYIDGVFSGGGIKGLALVGAFEVIEQRGFQFSRLAGTSAGSIVAALIAAKYTSEEIAKLLEELDLQTFMDERRLLIPFPLAKWFFLYWKLGLYKGEELEKWIEDKLARKGIKTFSDLPHQSLRFVASDITNGALLILPDDLPKYGLNPHTFSVAKAIRMSCSLPYFFEPVSIGSKQNKSLIVDGGVLSNFPMWLFDQENVLKTRPVLGIKLSHNLKDHPKHQIHNAIDLFGAMFETMKDAHDSRYISRKHEKNIIFVPTEGVLATEFTLTKEDQEKLIQLGRDYADKFFRGWSY
ncbi:patatin-like phospholipase family protein [Bacillus sp. B1-b2]|uniref:patatin-like phospholipase family protein n=1 Tax=Bacillus sp. B1-b2 TaxID=2653201 RepID=UPI0012622F0C|nr:patatin-like phospholipase family protein [Bacillus sp. B1-b2]KAB7670125.1 patatin-like phospholipase family protein [Bacillus sp. B1-b2]